MRGSGTVVREYPTIWDQSPFVLWTFETAFRLDYIRKPCVPGLVITATFGETL